MRPRESLSEARQETILRVVFAVGALILSGLLLALIVYGYLLAIHHELPPNGSFGFRDSTTRKSLAAWYAGQEAGFRWLLFGGGSVLVLNAVFTVFCVVKRRPPWQVAAFSVLAILLLLAVTVAAGLHADSVAKTFS